LHPRIRKRRFCGAFKMFVIFRQNSTKFSEALDFLHTLRIFVFVTDNSSNFVLPGRPIRLFSNFRKAHLQGFQLQFHSVAPIIWSKTAKLLESENVRLKQGIFFFAFFSALFFGHVENARRFMHVHYPLILVRMRWVSNAWWVG